MIVQLPFTRIPGRAVFCGVPTSQLIARQRDARFDTVLVEMHRREERFLQRELEEAHDVLYPPPQTSNIPVDVGPRWRRGMPWGGSRGRR